MIKSILLIGLGGIGSNLLAPLNRLVKNKDILLVLADGDVYKPENSERQNVVTDIKEVNKAVGSASFSHNNYTIGYSDYINKDNVKNLYSILPKPLLVVCAVDNNASRKLTLEALEGTTEEIHWLSPSNNEDSLVQISYYSNKTKGINPLERYNNIGNPTDVIPNKGCEDSYASHPQLLRTNVVAAGLTLSLIYDLFLNIELPVEVTMDLTDYTASAIYLE